jgi:hypothetical protein
MRSKLLKEKKLTYGDKFARLGQRLKDPEWRKYLKTIINPDQHRLDAGRGLPGVRMQAGFTMLEAGFCRSRETVNVLVECVFDTCLCGFLYYTWGYAFMFGQGNGLIGWHDPNDVAGGGQQAGSSSRTSPPPRSTAAPAYPCWLTGSSSSPSPTAPRPSAPAR